MMNYRCMVCGTEYENIPFEGCSTPGCGNMNPALYEFIVHDDDPVLESKYNNALQMMDSGNPEDINNAKLIFDSLGEYKDAKKLAEECGRRLSERGDSDKENKYREANDLLSANSVDSVRRAKDIFMSISGYKDSDGLAQECDRVIARLSQPAPPKPVPPKPVPPKPVPPKPVPPNPGPVIPPDPEKEAKYQKAKELYTQGTIGSLTSARDMFRSIEGFKDSATMRDECTYKLAMVFFAGKNDADKLTAAKNNFLAVRHYKDSAKMAVQCDKLIQKLKGGKKSKKTLLIVIAAVLAVIAAGYGLSRLGGNVNPTPSPTSAPDVDYAAVEKVFNEKNEKIFSKNRDMEDYQDCFYWIHYGGSVDSKAVESYVESIFDTIDDCYEHYSNVTYNVRKGEAKLLSKSELKSLLDDHYSSYTTDGIKKVVRLDYHLVFTAKNGKTSAYSDDFVVDSDVFDYYVFADGKWWLLDDICVEDNDD